MKKGLILTLGLFLVCIAAVAFAENSMVVTEEAQDQVSWGAYTTEKPEYEYEYEIPEPKENTPDRSVILQGGDNLADAFVITSLPFDDSGSTAGYTNDWDPICCGGCWGGPDVVYSYTPTENMKIDVTTCGAHWYDVFYIFENDSNTVIACNDMYGVCPPRSGVTGVPLYAGNTYYFVEDGYMNLEGEYGIHITPVLELECPPEAILEGETGCGNGYFDDYNAGCNDPSNPRFLDINIGDLICGTGGDYVRNDTSFRDTDWYRIELTEPKVLHWYVTAEFPVQGFIMDADDENCDNIKGVVQGQVSPPDTVHIAHNALPGVYYFYVSPLFYSGYECPLTYLAWLEAEDPPTPPVNDNCEDVAFEHLTPTNTIIVEGSTIGGTTQCRELELIPEVWTAFDIVAQSDVKLEYCGTNPSFNGSYIVLSPECPCTEDLVYFSNYNHYECGDNNTTLNWEDLPTGSYYYPIMSKIGFSEGDYHITISSTSDHPSVAVDQEEIYFSLESGTTGSMPWTISNPGYGKLYFGLLPGQEIPSPEWLDVDSFGDSIEVGGEAITVNLLFDATSLADGDYIGNILISSNVPDNAEFEIPVTLHVGPAGYAYMPGDANMAAGTWPPTVVGGDVTYLVNYFRSIVPACKLDNFFASADINASCTVTGGDVTYLVNYFRGMNDRQYCPDFEPLWINSGDLPTEAPSGWPNCAE